MSMRFGEGAVTFYVWVWARGKAVLAGCREDAVA
jgi:hypothetical protein